MIGRAVLVHRAVPRRLAEPREHRRDGVQPPAAGGARARRRLTRGLAHHASVPLYFQGKPLGIMNITAPAMRRLTKAELRLLATIGLQVGIAIERARLAEESAMLARADERTRLAREIHDTLAQGLTAIALQIETALQHVGRDPDRVRERLEQALATARASLEEARRSVIDLRAGAAGRQAAGAGAGGAGARVHVASPASASRSRRAARARSIAAAEAELFRIAQQALANVRQHAHAKTVGVALACTKRSAHADDRGRRRRLRSRAGSRRSGTASSACASARALPAGRCAIASKRRRRDARDGDGAAMTRDASIVDDHPIVREGLVARSTARATSTSRAAFGSAEEDRRGARGSAGRRDPRPRAAGH